mmetsp:Transcript_1958/g.5156  ORF Transcript_1958/g.5156 Transcript_1958/m.5156 type:complete len:324 (+) Transcript_1958:65-1036(+)
MLAKDRISNEKSEFCLCRRLPLGETRCPTGDGGTERRFHRVCGSHPPWCSFCVVSRASAIDARLPRFPIDELLPIRRRKRRGRRKELERREVGTGVEEGRVVGTGGIHARLFGDDAFRRFRAGLFGDDAFGRFRAGLVGDDAFLGGRFRRIHHHNRFLFLFRNDLAVAAGSFRHRFFFFFFFDVGLVEVFHRRRRFGSRLLLFGEQRRTTGGGTRRRIRCDDLVGGGRRRRFGRSSSRYRFVGRLFGGKGRRRCFRSGFIGRASRRRRFVVVFVVVFVASGDRGVAPDRFDLPRGRLDGSRQPVADEGAAGRPRRTSQRRVQP